MHEPNMFTALAIIFWVLIGVVSYGVVSSIVAVVFRGDDRDTGSSR